MAAPGGCEAMCPVVREPRVGAAVDDPWIALDRAHSLAASWGSHFVDIGEQGHINAASGLGQWPEGQELLDRIVDATIDGSGRTRTPGDAHAMLRRSGPSRSAADPADEPFATAPPVAFGQRLAAGY